jgi:hypothetical protein
MYNGALRENQEKDGLIFPIIILDSLPVPYPGKLATVGPGSGREDF